MVPSLILKNFFLESVDSEIFDNGPFQSGGVYLGSSEGHHTVSSPFEVSQYPIEIKETKDALQRQISQR